ncbi:uncharacterized protein EDB91DRAFT_1246973 [Suillus paluster]|uniref:uncharacterized protein n=1 Tax=Suillus paluster TaxID=48578 RepID=UPI001B861473|nr:uncharacterized protein EDB91DRAFT_1246973 [Suillus paluster]KAG1744091.1 hypothetical protein EDB91DRAFT_1246973 [Suillus paluster]
MSCKANSKRAKSPTPPPPVSKTRGRNEVASTLQVPDEQYEEFLKFQAQKKKEAECSHKEDVRKKVDTFMDEESDIEQEVLTDKKIKRGSDVEVNNQTLADSSGEEGDDSNSTATTEVRRTNGLIQVKDESTDDTTDRLRRKCVPKGDVKPLTTLASLKKDGCGPFIDLAHQLLRIKVALEVAFPGPSVDIQDSFTWDCIKEAAKDPGSPLKPMLDMIGSDDVLKSRAIAYVWSGASQLRGELVRKARDTVIFQLQQMHPKEIGDIANWLLTTKKDPFFCGELDLKAKTFNKNLPFRASLLHQLLYSQNFQGPGSEGVAYMECFQKLPNNLIALLATAGECAYKGMLTGSPVVVDFKEPIFQPRHQYYMSKLNSYQERSPMYMEKLCKDLWTELG